MDEDRLEKREITEDLQEEATEKKSLDFVKGVLFGTLISAVCVLAVFLINNGTIGLDWLHPGDKAPGSEVLSDIETRHKLEEVRRKIDSSFLYEVDGDNLSDYLFKGVAAGLKDPYAEYYTVEELKTINDANEGEYYGIGITLMKNEKNGRLLIMGVYDGSPADEAGIRADDEIVAVDGQDVTSMDLSSSVALIREDAESVKLTLMRGDEEKVFHVSPSSVEIPTVSCKMLEDQTGYLKIAEFDNITVQQFRDAMQQLEDQGMEKLVIDLRDNPGGMLLAVCDILEQILPEGLIVYTEDKNQKREEFTCEGKTPFEKPLAVLVNHNSASASEIFAGAVQDYAIGTIIGEVTYGKGVVQRTFVLDDGSALKLTSEKYFTPKGQDIDGNGITPDIEVEQPEAADDEEEPDDVQLKKAIEVLTGGEENQENAA